MSLATASINTISTCHHPTALPKSFSETEKKLQLEFEKICGNYENFRYTITKILESKNVSENLDNTKTFKSQIEDIQLLIQNVLKKNKNMERVITDYFPALDGKENNDSILSHNLSFIHQEIRNSLMALGHSLDLDKAENSDIKTEITNLTKSLESTAGKIKQIQNIIRKNSSQIKILIVEDNNINFMLLKRMLIKLDIDEKNIDIAKTAKSAIEKLINKQSYDIICMDKHLPYSDDGTDATHKHIHDHHGDHLARKFKEEGFSGKIIATTGSKYEDLQNKVFFDGFIQKPYQLKDLSAQLNEIWEKTDIQTSS